MANRKSPKSETPDEMLNSAAEQSGMPKQPKKGKDAPYESVYALKGDSKIPVSKHEGKSWQAKMEGAIKIMSGTRAAWEEAIKYFNNDQLSHRQSTDGSYSGNKVTSRLTRGHSETENIVFSNVSTLTDVVYAKNPEVEITSQSESFDDVHQETLKDLLNALAAKASAPGVGLKYRAKRCVMLAELTNNAWIKLCWTPREASSAAAMKEYEDVVEKMSKAKNTKELQQLEGQLMCLEEKVAIYTPKGASLKVVPPHMIIVDPTGTEPIDDRNWLIEIDYLPTEYLNYEYGDKDEEGGKKFKSKYDPTHYLGLNGDTSDVQSMVNNFSIISAEGETDWQKLGFKSMEAYQKACYTEVAWVWDKIKRRLLLYATNDWTWPLWVWDDPLKLQEFFPYYPLGFYLNPLGGQTKGEVTYYLDQQDAINEINDEQRKSRDWLKRNILFNKRKVSKEDIEQYLKGADGTARGVDLAEGEKWEEVVWSATPPSFKFTDWFSQQKQEKMESINRISSMNDVLSGVQFKTNTTNQAINSYQQSSSIRTDGRVDCVEDWLGAIFWGMAQLFLMNYSPEEVGEILNKDVTASWKQTTDPKELAMINARVVGGSTTKPTSANKKKEAVEVAQALGQFAKAAPMVLVKVLEVLENAFDELVISDTDWADIKESIMKSMAGSVGGAPGQPGQEPMPGAPGPENSQQGGGDIEQQLAQLPPQAQQAVRNAVERGVSPEVALQEVLKRTSG